jgi:small subunit ribosomal protein S18
MEREHYQDQTSGAEESEGGYRPSRMPRAYVAINISDVKLIHHKNIEFLRQFVTERGKMRPRRQTGISARHQRLVSQAVKRARHLALLPFDREAER